MKKNIKKVLVVVAHPDDEVLGCGGTILKHVAKGDKASILILGDGETSRDEAIDVKKRKNQAIKAAKLMKADLFLEKLPDNKFDSLPLLEIIKIIEKHLKRIKPEIIYTHNFSDLNIDHRIVFESVITACRPLPGFSVKKIFSFEVLSSTEWQASVKKNRFSPTFYNDISPYIDEKVKILQVYKKELRKYPHPRSIEGVKTLAKYRGMESGYKYAEAFQTIRYLKD